MDKLQAFLPSGEKGYLPYYLFVVSPAARPRHGGDHNTWQSPN